MSIGVPRGFTLIETLVTIGILSLFVVGISQVSARMFDTVQRSRLNVTATALANEQVEIVRNLPYADVGIVGGVPSGKLRRLQTLVRDRVTFDLTTTVRNIDDPFDGTVGGTPRDLSPADYKLVEMNIACPLSCRNFSPLSFTTHVGPKALEASSTNGSLFVRVFDASGQAVAGANVHLENNLQVPALIIDDATNEQGLLQIIDVPPGVQAYSIAVSKNGYSSDRTYPLGDPGNPNPLKPHATVAIQQLTEISFAIDRTSSLAFTSINDRCARVDNFDFTLSGAKLIGSSPDILKYKRDHVTDTQGRLTVTDLEWDTYTLISNDTAYDLIGSVPAGTLTVNPNTAQDVELVLATRNPLSLLVTVKDAATQQPLVDAAVNLQGPGYNTTLTTRQRSLASPIDCVPTGQVIFSGLASNSYTLTVTLAGYQPFTDTVNVSQPWQQREVGLRP